MAPINGSVHGRTVASECSAQQQLLISSHPAELRNMAYCGENTHFLVIYIPRRNSPTGEAVRQCYTAYCLLVYSHLCFITEAGCSNKTQGQMHWAFWDTFSGKLNAFHPKVKHKSGLNMQFKCPYICMQGKTAHNTGESHKEWLQILEVMLIAYFCQFPKVLHELSSGSI